MGDELSDIGDLVFSIVIGYIGALEFLYVVRHLYHWSFRHGAAATNETSAESLKNLQDSVRNQLADAESREAPVAAADIKAMKDGVFYKDGFRLDPQQGNAKDGDLDVEQLKDQRRKEIADELARQQKIEEETRQQLVKAEKELERQRQQAAEEEAAENARKLLEAERAREEEQKRREIEEAEAAENTRKLLEAERAREEEQKRRDAEEEAAENTRKLLEAERAREEEQKRREAEEQEVAENTRKLLEAERAREEEQKLREIEEEEAAENTRKFLEVERAREEEQKLREIEEEEAAENTRKLLEAERVREEEQNRLESEEEQEAVRALEQELAADIESLIIPEDDLEGLTAILHRKEAEASEQLLSEEERQRRKVEKQKLIDENARKFLEAELKMVEEMQHMDERVHMRQQSLNFDSGPQTPIVEEPCLRKFVNPLTGDCPDDDDVDASVQERCMQTVKTQFGQTSSDKPYAVRTKALLFPGVSDDGSSNEPASSAQSSFSAQLSEDIATGTGSEAYPQVERQEPEGEDNIPAIQYTDEYLRSLDGIKHRPLVREDGSGRRRAFKKRRSSGSSNSSRESRTSREEELKMFTSLEEEELDKANGKGSTEDFARIKYTSEPTLKVKGHHKRHKRSPAKDTRTSEDNLRSSLEMLGEETTNPWGEVMPEHYKDSAFWKREKAMSIDEEEIDLEKVLTPVESPIGGHDDELAQRRPAKKQDGVEALNMPKTSSFEEATHTQNEEAISALQQKQSAATMEEDTKASASSSTAPDKGVTTSRSDTNQNLQTSQETEDNKRSPSRSSVSPCLRRSPRIEEMDQYEERWIEQNPVQPQPQTPTVTVHAAAEDTAPWRDEHGLLMEGLSDFYDFTASVNPSRSRSTSRNPSPFNSPPTTPGPKNVCFDDVDVRTDTGNVAEGDFHTDNITDFIEPFSHDHDEAYPLTNDDNKDMGQYIRLERNRSRSRSRSPLPTPRNIERSLESRKTKMIRHNDEIFEKLVGHTESELPQSPDVPIVTTNDNSRLLPATAGLHSNERRSRSRSKSPLPSAENMEHNLKMRRHKLIKRNDDIFEKLQVSPPISPVPAAPTISIEDCVDATSTTTIENYDDCSREEMSNLVASLRLARTSRSRSKSPMRIPTAENMSASVETRRKKLIERNDQIYEQLLERSRTPEPPQLQLQGRVNVGAQEDCRLSRSRTPSRSLSGTPPNVNEAMEQRFPFVERPVTEPNFEIDENQRISREIAHLSDYYDFHTMLNLEASHNRTLSKNSEELESMMAAKERQVDREALHKLNTANEETELRTLTPLGVVGHNQDESADIVGELKSPGFREYRSGSSPHPEDFDRSLSAEWRDVQRIKTDLLASGFKRSTYVDESLDLAGGSEYEEKRREAMAFRRSQSPSRSLNMSGVDVEEEARQRAADRRMVQEEILNELISAGGSTSNNINKTDDERHGAKPKRPLSLSSESSMSMSVSQEALDTLRIKEDILRSGFQRSTYVGESVDLSARKAMELEEMRREMAEFQRSQSRSRSPLDEYEADDLRDIEFEAAKREMKDKILDEIEQTTINFQDFSRHLNVNFLDNDRRASDSALIQKPEILIQFRDSDPDLEMDPEDYHHFRRFSLNQEQPVEEYPTDDYVYISQIEVRTPTGTRTWLREDFYSDEDESMGNFEGSSDAVHCVEGRAAAAAAAALFNEADEEHYADEDALARGGGGDDDYTDGSEDERRTVVEVDDEIDTDICDFNERGPADESHHEQSECEEAEREMDQYASRSVDDWRDVTEQVANEMFDYSNAVREPAQPHEDTEGAVGGTGSYDSDSFTIDQIYDDAIRDRKQSGILRDYDCLVKDMQNHYMESHAGARSNGESDANMSSDSERYALWAKTRHLDRGAGAMAQASLMIEQERRDTEIRYLGDANVTARQSTRLRSRYGYAPVLQGSSVEEEQPIDLNYKPKREYNWRKNFKIDEDEDHEQPSNGTAMCTNAESGGGSDRRPEDYTENGNTEQRQCIDIRKFSFGGESITLFSRSPERDAYDKVSSEQRDNHNAEQPEPLAIAEASNEASAAVKPKKKKIKKKKSSRENSLRDEDDSESQSLAQYSRRSSSIQMDGREEASPKRKSRSQRSSKSSSKTSLDEPNGGCASVYSPSTGMGCADIAEEWCTALGPTQITEITTTTKKKIKKRSTKRSSKEATTEPLTTANEMHQPQAAEPHETPMPEATNKTHNNEQLPQIQEETNDNSQQKATNEKREPAKTTNTAAAAAAATAAATAVDSFDILKDANFYPLF